MAAAPGLRREELCRVKLTDLGEERGLLPIRPTMWAATLAYLEKSGRVLGQERADAPLFTPTRNQRGGNTAKALTATMIWYIVERHVKAAGIKKRITPHSLRHTGE